MFKDFLQNKPNPLERHPGAAHPCLQWQHQHQNFWGKKIWRGQKFFLKCARSAQKMPFLCWNYLGLILTYFGGKCPPCPVWRRHYSFAMQICRNTQWVFLLMLSRKGFPFSSWVRWVLRHVCWNLCSLHGAIKLHHITAKK